MITHHTALESDIFLGCGKLQWTLFGNTHFLASLSKSGEITVGWLVLLFFEKKSNTSTCKAIHLVAYLLTLDNFSSWYKSLAKRARDKTCFLTALRVKKEVVRSGKRWLYIRMDRQPPLSSDEVGEGRSGKRGGWHS
jgi:hypothetical protein